MTCLLAGGAMVYSVSKSHDGGLGMGFKRIDTKLVHAGQPRIAGAVEMPIFQSAMFEYTGEASYHDLGYIRLNNTPNHKALHAKLAALEEAQEALIAASGMAAISTTLLTLLSAGDHLLAQSTLYGGTQDLIAHELPKLGIAVDLIDADDASSWATRLRRTTNTKKQQKNKTNTQTTTKKCSPAARTGSSASRTERTISAAAWIRTRLFY